MKVYPILTFDIAENKARFEFLNWLKQFGKRNYDNEYNRTVYISYMKSYIRSIKRVMKNSEDKEIRNLVDNYLSVCLKENNIVGVIVYDAIKNKETDDVKDVLFEEKNGKFYPYIEI